MSEQPIPTAELSPIKRALHEIRTLRARVEELESTQQRSNGDDSIAVIGMGLRFPGDVVDEESLWQLLMEGRDAVTEIPLERWDWRAYYNVDADAAGTMYTQHGGFLKDVDRFDAAFFGISPREAVAMDPQHRLALEVGWEALENSGYSPVSLEENRTGVFLGIANNDYGRSALADLGRIDAYTGSGNSPAMVAGRISYVLGLHGPSLAIDTSCSSSLVAIHLACLSLRAGECEAALAGGVNLILSPEINVALSKAHMMARDGRCKTFDEAADGYVRSEGCAIVVLKKLTDAVSAGDRILGVIRGSAVNHDGRSGGLTAPSGPAQAAVMRQALQSAGVAGADVSYVETHGTGTALGDPIEVETLASVMGEGRGADSPLVIGAVKSNIGHTEGVSGIAGFVKTLLALKHQTIPATLHQHHQNPHIAWDRLPVVVPTSAIEWKPLRAHRYAGVSSFGFSGTNAHVVLEEAPKSEVAPNRLERREHILTLSAKTEAALYNLCARFARALRECSAEDLPNFCFTANSGRNHFAYRVAVVGETAEQLAGELETYKENSNSIESSRMFVGNAEGSEASRIGFLFTGQGSQYAGMGRELYESAPVFRRAMDRCAAAWQQETGESLTAVLYPAEGAESHLLEQARYAQPALFAFEYALAELWRSWGVAPSVLLGHSLGEYVAAVIAGVFSVEDGLRLVCARARLMDKLETRGAMRSISASVEQVRAAIAGEKEVGIGVVNGLENVVISGAAEAVERIGKKLEGEGIRTRALQVTHAFHSPLLEPILKEFEEIAGTVKYHAPRIRIISNLTGETAKAEEIATPGYWRRHMRETVQFAAGLKAALATGCRTFIEIGPQPHLKALAVRADESLEDSIVISLRRQRPEVSQMLQAVAQLYVRGQKIDWNGFENGPRRFRIALPTYPFERQRYWLAGEDDASGKIWNSMTVAAKSQAKMAPLGMKVESFASRWEILEQLTVAQILKTFRELNAFTQPGTSHDAKSLAASCGILPAHERLLTRWLNLLSERGYLERNGEQYRNVASLPVLDMDAAWLDAELALTDDPYALEYLRTCTGHLYGVLRGTTSPLETLFPGNSPELARHLYEGSGGTRYANLIVAAAVQAACMAAPQNRRVRILELGGGTGATTAAVLPLLPADRVSYHFTDVSEVFLERANAEFRQYPFVRYGILDIENDQHLAKYAGSFDIVIAANVVHATRDLMVTLSGVRGLLTPGGTAVLLESTKDLAWHDITIGLVRGWQKSEDDLRTASILLGAEDWISAMGRSGFEDSLAVPEAGSPAEDLGLHVILARTPLGDGQHARPGNSSDTISDTEWISVGEKFASTTTTTAAMDALLRDIPPSERHGVVLGIVCEEVGRILRLPDGDAPKKRDRLMDLGMDSLMAVELRNRLGARLGLESLPATLIFDYPTPDAISGYVLERIGDTDAPMEEVEFASASGQHVFTADEVAELSEDDVANLLRSRLAR